MHAKRQELIKGIVVSPGIVRAPAFVVGDEASLTVPRHPITEAEVGGELAKFDATLREAEATLPTLRAEVLAKIGPHEAEIFDAQIVLLRDPMFVNEVSARLTADKRNVEAVVADVVERFSQMFSGIADPLLRERAGDVRDVGRRVLACLLQQHPTEPLSFPAGVILVAAELALKKTWDAVPEPKIVIAVGACAIAGGPFVGHPQHHDGTGSVLPVDRYIPGCPPHPLTIFDGLLRLLGRLEEKSGPRADPAPMLT